MIELEVGVANGAVRCLRAPHDVPYRYRGTALLVSPDIQYSDSNKVLTFAIDSYTPDASKEAEPLVMIVFMSADWDWAIRFEEAEQKVVPRGIVVDLEPRSRTRQSEVLQLPLGSYTFEVFTGGEVAAKIHTYFRRFTIRDVATLCLEALESDETSTLLPILEDAAFRHPEYDQLLRSFAHASKFPEMKDELRKLASQWIEWEQMRTDPRTKEEALQALTKELRRRVSLQSRVR